MLRLSRTAAAVLAALSTYRAGRGYAPTLRELGDLVGKCRAMVLLKVRELHRAGLVTYVPRGPRTLALTARGEAAAAGREPVEVVDQTPQSADEPTPEASPGA